MSLKSSTLVRPQRGTPLTPPLHPLPTAIGYKKAALFPPKKEATKEKKKKKGENRSKMIYISLLKTPPTGSIKCLKRVSKSNNASSPTKKLTVNRRRRKENGGINAKSRTLIV
jgi:hypothetical protein